MDEHGREPGQVEFYRMTHIHQDNNFVSDESSDIFACIDNHLVPRFVVLFKSVI